MTNKHAIHKQFTTHYSLLTNLAFTLAETLIVMGIIGVVAALTLPNLNSSTGDKEKVAKLQKIYSNLSDALGRAEAVYGPVAEWCPSCPSEENASKKFGERILDFIKTSKICNSSNINTCFGAYEGNRDEQYSFEYWVQNWQPAFIFADGSSAVIYLYKQPSNLSGQGAGDVPEKQVLGWFFIDLDGNNKGKHMGGIDIFQFLITTKGIVPVGGENYVDQFNPNGGADFLATDWVIRTGNMDYLKVKSGKCPDGKTVLNLTTNTTCK
ncbi:type II secretion system protein [bacterium]|nr:type II secretion system protein [bacterium]